jgi:hypothetical protein
MIIYPEDFYGWPWPYPIVTANYPNGTPPAYLKTGKENALYSLAKAIQAQIAGWTGNLNPTAVSVSLINYNESMGFPCITVNDVGGPSLGAFAMGRELAPGYKGYDEQSQVEINCYDQNIDSDPGTSAYGSAAQNVRRMRDVVKDFLENSAQQGYDGNLIYPAIELVDGNAGDQVTGSYVWFQQEDSGSWAETFIENQPEMVNIKRYRIYAKIRWHRFTTTPGAND